MIIDISSNVYPDDVFLVYKAKPNEVKSRMAKAGFDGELIKHYDFKDMLKSEDPAHLYYDTRNPRICFIVINEIKLSYIVHELMHLSLHVLFEAGHEMENVHHTEPAAYLQQHYLERCMYAFKAKIEFGIE